MKNNIYDLKVYGKAEFLGWDTSGGFTSAEFKLLERGNTIVYLNDKRLKELDIDIKLTK